MTAVLPGDGTGPVGVQTAHGRHGHLVGEVVLGSCDVQDSSNQ